MTVITFLNRLAATKREWQSTKGLTGEREITLRSRPSTCPYLAVSHGDGEQLTGPGAVPWTDVWDAADDRPGHNPVLRRALLDACGL